MFRFIRTATARTAASLPAAIKFGTEVTDYLNKRYSINMKFGVEQYGGACLYWQFDSDSVDKMQHLNAELMGDGDYIKMLDKTKDLWVEGSMQDRLVSFIR